jgi:tRNA G10  N-methylase Trm11
MYIAILGRQPAISMAELERLYGDVTWFSNTTARIHTDLPIDVQRLGGVSKVGRIVAELPGGEWRRASMKLVQAYSQAWSTHEGKITLGISSYGFDVSAREVQKTGIVLKAKLKQKGVSFRLVPNDEAALSSATSHHNKLGLSDNKVELLVIKGRGGKVVIAESTGAQNITALARRDQGRPARDAFVGMLPPKLALTMINLTGLHPAMQDTNNPPVVLDPFCGTGVLLQEALLLGYKAYGSDLSDKMIDYSTKNLDWLITTNQLTSADYTVHQGDAMTAKWQQPIDAIACESYLGQPFSAPPSADKLTQVRGNCDHIITEFLQNIGNQITPGTPLCVAVPAWRAADGSFTHLPLIKKLAQLGYHQHTFKNVRADELLYYREDQVVARELLVLERI